jgi:hypothetical protein
LESLAGREGFPNPAEGKSKSEEGKSKPGGRKTKTEGRKIQALFFHESSLFNGLRGPGPLW